jgi:hypothetical protein
MGAPAVGKPAERERSACPRHWPRARHFAFIIATVVSSILLLKPHSLWLRPGG